MTDSIAWRIVWPFVALVVGSLSALGLILAGTQREAYVETRRDALLAETRLLAELAAPVVASAGGQPTPEFDGLAKRWGRDLGARVTLIALDGTVLGDSDEDARVMENHAGRPEVLAALASGAGSSTRHSATLDRDLLYTAAPVQLDGALVGVARLSVRLAELQAAVDQHARAVTLISIVTALLAAVIAAVVARSTTLPIRRLTQGVTALAEGDLTRRIPVTSGDEVGSLAFAFNHMAARIEDTVAQIDGERARLATVLANLTDGILVLNHVGEITLANAAATRLLAPTGRLGEPVRGTPRTLAQLARSHELDEAWRRCLAERQPQTRLIEHGALRRQLRVTVAPLGEGTRSALVVVQDLTDSRRTEAMRRDFVANVSHELRTPLASLRALVETLEDGALEDGEMARHFLGRMHVEVDGLTQLVQELLELSKIESGQVPLRLEPTAPGTLIERAAARLQPQAERRGLTLTCREVQGLPPVLCDAARMEQVLTNLLQNAVKFSAPVGEVSLRAQLVPADGAWPEQVALAVSDTGIGIARADLPRIFERFYKVDRSRTGGGTGLGLAIAKHLVLAHGGRIWAESAGEGQGATFWVTLPIAAAGEVAADN